MEQIILNINDNSKISFLIQPIKQLDFVEIEKVKKGKPASNYDFFSSAGLWSNRDLDAKELRKQAWKRQK